MPKSIQDIVDMLTTPAIPAENTVDRILVGSPEKDVTGIAVTFLATQEVIEKAYGLGLNLIISHEGIFYSHWGKTEFLKSDPVYEQKCRTIHDSGITIFRYHDYIHKCLPDIITAGLLKSLDWMEYETENLPAASIVELPSSTVQNVITHIKKRLCLKYVRFVGDLSMPCRSIGVLVGYRGGGELVLPLFRDKNLDMVIYGEGPEWETPEYVRDALLQGKNKALVVLGHGESEMPGMEYFTEQLKKKLPDIPVHFISQNPIFQI